MKNQKGFTRHHSESGFVQIILILVFVVVAIGGFYYFEILKSNSGLSTIFNATPVTIQATVDDMSNWKSYANNKYNYSFQYPQELTISENCTVYAMGTYITCVKSSDFGFVLNEPDKSRPGSNPMTDKKGFGIFIDLIIPDYKYDIYTLEKEYLRNYKDVKLVTVNKTSMLKVISNSDSENIMWITIGNNNVFRITSPLNTPRYSVIDQILSTFKFIK